MLQFIIDNQVVIIAAALGLSEVLSLIPSVKSNGIFQLIVNTLKSLSKK